MKLERKIKNYLKRRVREAGGEARKMSWEGRKSAPDWLIMINGKSVIAELKKSGGFAGFLQQQEHEIMRTLGGLDVRVIDTFELVDNLILEMEMIYG